MERPAPRYFRPLEPIVAIRNAMRSLRFRCGTRFSADGRMVCRWPTQVATRVDGVVDQDAGHAWAEAYVPDLGWVAFDPANGISATDAHVRVAVGLDYLGVTPIRGTRYGGGTESMVVRVRVDQAKRQMQN